MTSERKRHGTSPTRKAATNGAQLAADIGDTGIEHAQTEPTAFEEALGRLDEMVSLLEDGQIPLEEALTLYEEGVRMAQRCQQMLDQAELRLQRLTANEQGAEDGAATYLLESFIVDEDV